MGMGMMVLACRHSVSDLKAFFAVGVFMLGTGVEQSYEVSE